MKKILLKRRNPNNPVIKKYAEAVRKGMKRTDKKEKIESCKENWDKIPFTSEHIWLTDGSVHNNPTVCEKCGKSYQEWSDEVLKRTTKPTENKLPLTNKGVSPKELRKHIKKIEGSGIFSPSVFE